MTKTQDVVIEIDPWASIDCPSFTTMSMDSNALTVVPNPTLSFSRVDLFRVRFEVTGGAKLFWEPEVRFVGGDSRDVDGGGVFVGEGSSVRFSNDLDMTDVAIASVPEEGEDFASYQLTGGCVYTDGYFRVDGEAVFTRCENSGGGESPPGPAGGVYVGEQGSVLFKGGVTMSEASITDNEGNNGAGIFNRGKVNIKGDSVFNDLRAESGGAFFNAAGGVINFRNGATALFTDCLASEEIGGALYNEGFFRFSGPALFVNSDAPAIYVAPGGETVLSERSAFWASRDPENPAVLVAAGGQLDIPSSVVFYETTNSDCSTVLYLDDDTCL